ncbi:ATP-binding protein [Candidatus Mycobacterium methanotrophicum]|uniref:ATP-binding protein n=1 Tax=Candidatus Mycobacterium methanotrophicum TaxID=2943498 RepID=A0ABY4QM35_9MYCO|nr:ATP-binding protein [Candidatus Mycobacterium methanotrophicum]UQX11567.1 ATP-binding protein [Candidatus Mycobacterium methanotrophicum]
MLHPLEVAFLIAARAKDQATLDLTVKRLREALTGSGQIAVRHFRGAQTRLWAAFNPAAPILTAAARRHLGITSTAALMTYIRSINAELPVPDLNALDVTVWLTGSLDLPTAEEMNTPHLYERLSDRKRASVAVYGMLVRLARVTFFANPNRFGLIVLEEAAALLNSRAGTG